MAESDNINLEELLLNNMVFSDLHPEIQQEILKRNIIFQGENTSLQDLLTPSRYVDFDEIIDAELLSKLARNETITVGNPLNRHNTEDSLYVHRRFIRFCEECSEHDLCTYDDFPSVINIWACPGYGKSTILDTLASVEKNRYPNFWVIKINLADYSEVFREFKNAKFVSVLDLLDSISKTRIDSKFEREIFSIRYKVVLIIDGLDEVHSEYSEIIKSIISDYEKNHSFAKVYVACSENINKDLNNLLWLRTTIIDLSDEDKIHLLKGCVEQSEHFNLECETLIKQKWFGDHKNKFIGVPLQFRMLAEVFNKRDKNIQWDRYYKFLTFYNKSSKREEIDLCKLYLLFVHQNCFKNKTTLGENKPMDEIGRINKETNFYLYKVALENVLSKTQCKLFGCYGNGTKEFNEDEKQMQFVEFVKKVNGHLQFFHRTIADYLTALCIVNELYNTPSEDFLVFFVEEILTKDEFGVIRFFLNDIITNDSISEVILAKIGHILSKNNTRLHPFVERDLTDLFKLILKCFESVNTDLDWEIIRFKGKTLLQTAISVGSVNLMELLVEKGASVNSRDDEERTPLHEAILKDNLEAVEFLVQNGSEINCRNLKGRSPLHEASGSSHLNVVKYLLTHGANMETKDKRGSTCLHYAAGSGCLDKVKYLVENGANINSKSAAGTPIFHAVRELHVDIIKYFLEKGARLDFKNDLSQNVVHALQTNLREQTEPERKTTVEIVKLLIEKGVDVNNVNYLGDTVLHSYIARDTEEIVELLVDSGVKIEIANKKGFFPLDIALRCGAYNVVKLLVERGATKYCLNSLSLAVISGDVNIVRYLIEKDLKPNFKTHPSYRMLWRAIYDNNVDMIRCLVENGADVNEEEEDSFLGTTLLEDAIRHCGTDVVKFLIEHGAVAEYAIHSAARKGDITLVKYLEEKDFAAGQILNIGGNLELLKYLLQKGYNVDMSFILHNAALNGDLHIVKYALDQGTDVNVGNHTALHKAAKRDHLHIVKFLLKRGARLNIRDDKCETALEKALRRGNLNMSAFLLKKHSDINAALERLLKKFFEGGDIKDGRLEFVLEQGVKIDMSDKRFRSLFTSCLSHDFSLAEYVAGRNVGQYRTVVDLVNYFIKIKDDELLTRIFSWYENVKYLLEREVQVGVTEIEDYNLLILVAKNDDLKLVEYLLMKGAEVNFKNHEGCTALHETTSFSVAKLLVQNGADVNAQNNEGVGVLQDAVALKNHDICKFLVERGANLNHADKSGHTVLYTAATKGSFSKFKYLASKGAKFTAGECETVLHDVIKLNDFDLIKCIIENGGKIEGKDDIGRTVLYKAVETNNLDIVGYLVRMGGKVIVEDQNSVALLQYARDKSHFDVVRYLESVVGKDFGGNSEGIGNT